MTKPSLVHPTPALLAAFARGQLDGRAQAELEGHIAQCSSCCEALRQVPDDTLLGRLKTSDTDPGQQFAPSSGPAAAPPTTDIPPELAEHPKYRVIKPLGYGGMGVVYQAEHRLMERPVAIKVVSRALINNATAVERFRLEVKNAARLLHPNIVAAHDADQAGDLHFLVMEYVDGVSLARVVEKRGPLPVNAACNYIRQAAGGLKHAYERGMVHRDIKPQNLMLTKKWQVKILDFGLARFARETEPSATLAAADLPPDNGGLTSLGMVLGTPDYIAPEQTTNSHQADIRADIYSLGCTLYYLLSGHTPFPQGSVLDKLAWHRDGTPRPIDQIRDDVPADVVQILDRMMAKDPNARYQTPAEVVEVLAGFSKAVAPPPVQVAALSGVTAKPRPPQLAPTIDMVAPGERTPQPATPLPAKLNPLDGFDLPVGSVPMVAWRQGDWSQPRRRRRLPRFNKQLAATLGGVLLLVIVSGLAYTFASREPPQEPPSPIDSPKAAAVVPSSQKPVTAASRGEQKTVLFVLPSRNFYYPDYAPVRSKLESRGVKVVVAAPTLDYVKPDFKGGGELVKPDLLLADALASDYDALVFGGGDGVAQFKSDKPDGPAAHRLIRDMLKLDRPVAALCMGPAVLADAGVLKGKPATCYSPSIAVTMLEMKGAQRVDEPVVESGRIITGRDPHAAGEFADALLRQLGE